MTEVAQVAEGEFRCERCGRAFPKAWTDEEAAAEAKAVWGAVPAAEEAATICDDCYQEFIAWARTQGITIDGGGR